MVVLGMWRRKHFHFDNRFIRLNILLPQSQQHVFVVPGYHTNSPQLVFPDVQPPLQVSSGQELRVWYGEDWIDGSENDNGGLSCVGVYARIV